MDVLIIVSIESSVASFFRFCSILHVNLSIYLKDTEQIATISVVLLKIS